MLRIIHWLTNVAAGYFLATQMAPLKREANGDCAEEAGKRVGPMVMDSQCINSTLQSALSSDSGVGSDNVYMEASNATFKQNYTLGSESLNRLLEEVMLPSLDLDATQTEVGPTAEL